MLQLTAFFFVPKDLSCLKFRQAFKCSSLKLLQGVSARLQLDNIEVYKMLRNVGPVEEIVIIFLPFNLNIGFGYSKNHLI